MARQYTIITAGGPVTINETGARQYSIPGAQINETSGSVAAPFSLDDWPNPVRARAHPAYHFVMASSLALLTATSNATKPFAQTNWPLPNRPVWRQSTGPFPSINTNLLTNPMPPRAQTSWPNPNRSKPWAPDQIGYLDGSEVWLFNAVVVAPFSQTNWPNPRGRGGLIADQLGFIDPSETWLIGQDTFFGAPGEVPAFDWPNPQRPRSSPSAYGWIDQYKVNLFFVQPPFAQLDWPNPVRARARAADQTGFIDSSETWLIGQDTFFGAPGQVPSYDWPNPVRARPSPVTYSGHSDAYKIALFQIVFVPFAQLDWPNPVRARVGVDKTFINPVATQLIGLDQFFGAPGEVRAFDWPNPVRAKPAPTSYAGHLDAYKIGLFQIVFVPFAQLDWPNPVRARGRPTDQLGYIYSSETWLIGQDQFFGAPGQPPTYDWPNPVRAKAPLASYAGHVDPYKLNLFQIFSPFYQNDWPNPRGAVRTVGHAGFVDPYKIALFAQAPFFQSDWPNPRATARTIAHTGWADVYKTNLYASPFFQTDWPNPRGPRATIDLKTFTSPIAIQLIGKDKFFGPPGMPPTYDWPNPVRARRVQQPTSFAMSLNAMLFANFTSKYARKLIGQAIRAFIVGKPDTATLVSLSTAVEVIGSTLMTVHDPIDFVCGDSWELTGPLNDANGVPLNLVGASISWKLDNIDGTVNYLTLSLGSGIVVLDQAKASILVEVSKAQSAVLLPGTYKDWLRVTLATGDAFTEWSGVIRASVNPI